MVEFIVLLLFLVLVNVLFSLLKRRSEHRSGWKAHLEDNQPRQAGARKKVG
jgi:hypothetical protein